MINLLNTSIHEPKGDLVCFSHLRWNFVFQRPQHLMTRFAKHTRVYFIEEPIYDAMVDPYLEVRTPDTNLWVVTPHLIHKMPAEDACNSQQNMLDQLFKEQDVNILISWYYTPMALEWTRHLSPQIMVYDCMDELSAFKYAPPELKLNEKELLERSDLVFTGGESLYHLKYNQHSNVHCFPSSIDVEHFSKARTNLADPDDQKDIRYPRLGFFGVLDERLDITLLDAFSKKNPDWSFVFLGPVVKIEPESLPRASNIHYLGMKSYYELPNYISNWNIALLPFALNESTRYISPTKTPEYLAAGKPVISTPVHDVVSSYGEKGLVHIAEDYNDFSLTAAELLRQESDEAWLRHVDKHLSSTSWNQTWARMVALINGSLSEKKLQNFQTYV